MRLGIKTNWRDVDAMAAIAKRHGATVLEYQMLTGDLERHAEEAFDAFAPYRDAFELRVHQPECALDAAGQRFFLDPASPEARERDASTAALAEVARHAMHLRARGLVLHVGGTVTTARPAGGRREAFLDSLEDLPRHVPIFVENMPPVYMNEQFIGAGAGSPMWARDAAGLQAVVAQVDGFTLDVSHAWLTGGRANLDDFLTTLGPQTRHVHLNGTRLARGPKGGEGTPLDDSDYGPETWQRVLAAVHPDAVIVPEIFDGHLEGGRAFDHALGLLAPLVNGGR